MKHPEQAFKKAMDQSESDDNTATPTTSANATESTTTEPTTTKSTIMNQEDGEAALRKTWRDFMSMPSFGADSAHSPFASDQDSQASGPQFGNFVTISGGPAPDPASVPAHGIMVKTETTVTYETIDTSNANTQTPPQPPGPAQGTDAMGSLAAIDRRRKALAPKEETESQNPLHVMQALSTDDDQNAGKLEARAEGQRQDLGALRDFLEKGPGEPEAGMLEEVQGPKSYFDWDSEDEDDVENVFKVRQKRLHRDRYQRQAAGAGNSSIDKNSTGNSGNSSDRTVLRSLGNVISAGKWFSGKDDVIGKAGVFAEEAGTRGEGVMASSGVGHLTSFGKGSRRSEEDKRSSVLKLFDDPVWSAEQGGISIRDFAAKDGGATKQGNAAKDEVLKEGGMTGVSSPASRDPPSSEEIGIGTLSSTQVSSYSTRYMDLVQHDRSASAISESDCGLAAASDARLKSEGQSGSKTKRQQVLSKLPKGRSIRNLAAKFFNEPSIGAPPTAPLPSGYQRQALLAKSPHASRTPTKLRHELKPDEVFIKETRGPFTHGASEQSPGDDDPVIEDSFLDWAQQLDENSRTPAKGARNGPGADQDSPTKPVTPVPNRSKQPLTEVLEEVSPTSLGTPSPKSPGGLPQSPEDPGWDDAIKWVKGRMKEDEKKEKQVAQDLKKLKAGKDAVKRASQYGYKTMKPLQQMTQDEFEAVGIAATTPSPKGKKTSILGALFTKMRGSKKEQEEQASVIGRQLEDHGSLLPLKSASAKNVNVPAPEDQVHHDKALRLLEGEGYEENELVSPFDATPSEGSAAWTDASTPDEERAKTLSMLEGGSPQSAGGKTSVSGPLGLGISTQSRDRLEEYNRRAAQRTTSEFLEFRRQQQSATGGNGNAFWQQRAASNKGSAESLPFEKTSVGSGRPDNPHAARLLSETPSWTTDISDEQHDEWTLSSLEESDFADEIADFNGLTGPYRPNLVDFTPEVDRFLGATRMYPSMPRRVLDDQEDRDRTADSVYSRPDVFSDALTQSPEDFYRNSALISNSTPDSSTGFNAYDTADNDDSSSVYSQDLTDDAMPPPLNVPVLKVKGSSPLTRSTDPNAFVPNRSDSFTEKIDEARRRRQPKLSSHPALRGSAEPSQLRKEQGQSKPDLGRVDSGIGWPVSAGAAEDFTAAMVDRGEFVPSKQPQVEDLFMQLNDDNKWRWKTPNVDDNDAGETVGATALQELRNSLGLPAQRFPKAGQPRHPGHPYSWNHKKVMCQGIHNPANDQPQLPQMHENVPLNMSHLGSQYVNSSPKDSQTTGTRMCKCCGAACCRYATLLCTSKATSSQKLMEEMVRNTAQQYVNSLRITCPNGLEEYETFLTCACCGKHICPDCATKCSEKTCQAIVCKTCMAQSNECPVHNF